MNSKHPLLAEKVGICDDILNIVSPGGLPNSLTQADLQQGRSEIRNRVLARMFKELGYIEQWGSGIGRIKAMCREAGNAEPKIQERGDFVDWEFYRSTIDNTEPVAGSEDMSEKMSEKIVRFIQANPNITIDELSKLAEVSTRTIERNLKSPASPESNKAYRPGQGRLLGGHGMSIDAVRRRVGKATEIKMNLGGLGYEL